MKLYGFWRSTATWRVRIALQIKGLPYEYVPVHLVRGGGEQHADAFKRLNAMSHVPVLELAIDGTTHHVAESMAILELLEELAPEPALLPADRYLRARARQLALVVVSGIQPLQNTSVTRYVHDALHSDERAWARHWVERGLTALETLTRETAGRYSIGDTLSIADVCLAPQLYFARRFEVDLTPYPTLVAIDAACATLPAFQAAHAEAQIDAEVPAKPV